MNNNKQFNSNNSNISYFLKTYNMLAMMLRDKGLENKSLNIYLSNVEVLLDKVLTFKSPQKEEEFIRGSLMLSNGEFNFTKMAA